MSKDYVVRIVTPYEESYRVLNVEDSVVYVCAFSTSPFCPGATCKYEIFTILLQEVTDNPHRVPVSFKE